MKERHELARLASRTAGNVLRERVHMLHFGACPRAILGVVVRLGGQIVGEKGDTLVGAKHVEYLECVVELGDERGLIEARHIRVHIRLS